MLASVLTHEADFQALACDVLSYVSEDIKVIKRSGGLATTACFILARLVRLRF